MLLMNWKSFDTPGCTETTEEHCHALIFQEGVCFHLICKHEPQSRSINIPSHGSIQELFILQASLQVKSLGAIHHPSKKQNLQSISISHTSWPDWRQSHSVSWRTQERRAWISRSARSTELWWGLLHEPCEVCLLTWKSQTTKVKEEPYVDWLFSLLWVFWRCSNSLSMLGDSLSTSLDVPLGFPDFISDDPAVSPG